MFRGSHIHSTDTFKRLHSVVYLCIQLTFIKRLAGPALAGLDPGGSSSYPGLVELKSEREHLGKLSNEVGSKRDL